MAACYQCVCLCNTHAMTSGRRLTGKARPHRAVAGPSAAKGPELTRHGLQRCGGACGVLLCVVWSTFPSRSHAMRRADRAGLGDVNCNHLAPFYMLNPWPWCALFGEPSGGSSVRTFVGAVEVSGRVFVWRLAEPCKMLSILASWFVQLQALCAHHTCRQSLPCSSRGSHTHRLARFAALAAV